MKLQKRKCWKVEKRPKHKKLIKSKFIFKVKRDYLGQISKYKVRLVARGFTQEEGVDYQQNFSPVAKGVTFRLALAIALRKRLHMHQLDAETAFPYTKLYVDDIIIVPDDDDENKRVIAQFKKQYAIQDLGPLKQYLGITVSQQQQSMVVHQSQYAISVLERFAHLLPASSRLGEDKSPKREVKTPLPSGCKLSKDDRQTPQQIRFATRFPYQHVIGALMYLAVNIRPDLIVLSR
jgi:hypothetical protein